MPKKNRRTARPRRKPTKRFYITIGAALVLVAFVIFLATRGPETYVIAKTDDDVLVFEKDVSVTIIRDEKVVSVPDYIKADFYVSEGQSVTSGTKVATIYQRGLNEKALSDLSKVQQSIKDYQENTVLKGVINNDITEKNTQITKKMQEISDAITGKSNADLVTLERKLVELMGQKMELLKRHMPSSTEELKALETQESTLKSTIAEHTKDVQADGAGIVSFNLDGMEKLIVPEQITSGTLRKQNIDDAKKGIAAEASSDDLTEEQKKEIKEQQNENNKPLYRLVNNFKWYCVLYVDNKNEVSELREGDLYQMLFEAFSDRPYEAKIIKVTEEDGGKLYALEMSEDIGPLLSVRDANVTVKKIYGEQSNELKVPKKAVSDEDGKKIVKVLQDKTAVQVEVDVLISDDEHSIVRSRNENELQVGQTIMLR